MRLPEQVASCSSTGGCEAALANADRSVAMATFGSESGAASRAVNCASGRGNFEADDRPEAAAKTSPEICSGKRPFPSVVLEECSAIHPRALSTTVSREC